MNKTISILEWNKLANEGTAPPVRIQLNGVSMYPLIRMNLDYVTVASISDTLATGDVVLFKNRDTNRYVVHRIWKVEDGKVLIWGDNCPQPDGWYQMNEVLGKVVKIERGKRIIHPNPNTGLRWAKIWHKVRPGYYFAWTIKDKIACMIKKLKV